MPKQISDETKFELDEKKKKIIGTRITKDEFDVIDIQQQVNARHSVITAANEQIKEMNKELLQIEKYKDTYTRWQKEFEAEQKKQVLKSKSLPHS